MRIDYHDIHSNQFEDLAVATCKVILGATTQKFTEGKDGGRDGRFTGTANLYLSKANQCSGKFIIQAKHTHNPIAKMSDKGFYTDNGNCDISIEIERIKKLILNGEVDHYLLFTNRRDSANKSVEIESELLSLGLKTAKIFGIQNIDMFIKQFPQILTIADIDHMDAPLRVIPDELADVILSLREVIDDLTPSTESEEEDFNRIKFDEKCILNKVPDTYKKFILRNYLKEFDKVDEFLEMPANEELQTLYIDTALEFNAEIMEKIDNTKLDKILNTLIKRLKYRDGDLKRNMRLTRTVIYYMFWNCDIGLEVDA